jgi:galactose mutarotase-like enzyme
MAVKSWTLTDLSQDKYVDRIKIGPQEVGGSAEGYSITKHTLRGGLSDGVDVIRVDNGKFSFIVIPTRGMGIWKGWIDHAEIGWKSPVQGPVHPQHVDLGEPSGLGWLDGFDELFVRCGLVSNGAPEFEENGTLKYPLHGRIQNKPAHKVEVSVDGDTGEITITGEVDENRFHFNRLRLTTTIKTKVGETGFRVHDRVANLGGHTTGIQMLYHINFGLPMLDAGSQLVAPIRTVIPRNDHAASGIDNWNSYAAEQAGFEEQVYFLDLASAEDGTTQTMLKNAHSTQGVSLHFNKSQLPCFTLWKDTQDGRDGCVTGLEPGTNFPNPRSYEEEQKRVIDVPAGGSFGFDISLEVHPDAKSVEAAEQKIAALQEGVKPSVFNKPQKGWCAP